MTNERQLPKAPHLLPLYFRALVKRTSSSKLHKPLPILVLSTNTNHKTLKSYCKLCGIPRTQNYLPIFYPQVLAFKLHLKLLVHPSLPFPAMGLVHKDNYVDYISSIDKHDEIQIKVGVHTMEQTDKGINCQLFTHVYVGKELKWKAYSTYFYRKKQLAPSYKKHQFKKNTISTNNLTIWSLSADLGRQYARITGDLNPIHLFSFSAKMFGFKKPIIHGMYVAARAIAKLTEKKPSLPMQAQIEFHKPVFLPCQVSLIHTVQAFQLYPILNHHIMDKPMIKGHITNTKTQ